MQQPVMDPRIGVLVREGISVFYAFMEGYKDEPYCGSLNDVERALGVPLTPSQPTSSTPHIAEPNTAASTASNCLRRYAVSVTPVVVAYCGSSTIAGSTEYVYSASRNEAISSVRDAVRAVNGRHGQSFKYRARLAPE